MKKEQRFDKAASGINSSLLMMASLCLMLPFALQQSMTYTEAAVSTLKLSRVSSIIMLVAYAAYLFFQLKTHRQLFEEGQETEGEEVEEETSIGFISSIVWLGALTVVISLLSQYIVETIEEVAESWKISVNFFSIILLPIVGNAAEHAGAVLFALKNKLDISLAVAMGFATQIAMFVVRPTYKGSDYDSLHNCSRLDFGNTYEPRFSYSGDGYSICHNINNSICVIGWNFKLHEGAGAAAVLLNHCNVLLSFANTAQKGPSSSSCKHSVMEDRVVTGPIPMPAKRY